MAKYKTLKVQSHSKRPPVKEMQADVKSHSKRPPKQKMRLTKTWATVGGGKARPMYGVKYGKIGPPTTDQPTLRKQKKK